MKKFDLVIHAETAIPMSGGDCRVGKDLFIGIRGGVIDEVSPWKASRKKEGKKFLSTKGKVVMPGLVNGHTHLPMTLFRGLEDDVPFHVWLFERILPLEGKMVSRDFVKVGTELAALECIRFGVTTVNEMYFYAEETAKVWDKAGLRGIISQTMAKFPLPEDKDLGTDKFAIFEKLRKKFSKHKRIEIGMAPHAPYSCDDELLRKVGKVSQETGAPIHIHVSETKKEVEDSKKEFGISPVKRLQNLGMLSSRVKAAHCVHLEDEDREIFKKTGAAAIYNPDSNMKLGSGIAPVADYLKRGIPVCFGSDGCASSNNMSILHVMNIGTKLQKLASGDNTAMVAAQALRMATWGGAHALGLGNLIGSIEKGKRADIIFVDFSSPHMQPVHDPVSHLVYSASGLEVDSVICEGKVLYSDKKFHTLSEKKIYEAATKWKNKIQAELKGLLK